MQASRFQFLALGLMGVLSLGSQNVVTGKVVPARSSDSWRHAISTGTSYLRICKAVESFAPPLALSEIPWF
jgi:hypothetical protein